MKAVVFAYHSMGVAGIKALLRHGFEVIKVYTHLDDPDENVWFESVAKLCESEKIPFAAPDDVNAPEIVAEIKKLAPEIIFSFYYRRMLKKEVLEIAPKGALNLHGSLLPKLRGRSPTNWAIILGEKTTGVTLHYMVEKPDAGEIAGQEEVCIENQDTARTLLEKQVAAAAIILDRVLPQVKNGKVVKLPNDLSRGSYFGGRKPEDGKLNWCDSAWNNYNLIRAVTRPYPGAFTSLLGDKMMVWWAVPDDSNMGLLHPGEMEIEEGKVLVGTSYGALRLEEIEWRGKLLKGPDIAQELGPFWREKLG